MNVIDIMTKGALSISRNTTVSSAIDLMLTNNVRHLIVLGETGNLLGIVSDRDLRLAAQSPYAVYEEEKADAFVDTLTIDKVMTEMPECITPQASVSEAAQLMVDKRISALPVMRDGDVLGIVTTTDLLGLLVGMPL